LVPQLEDAIENFLIEAPLAVVRARVAAVLEARRVAEVDAEAQVGEPLALGLRPVDKGREER
jgi:hypothetical protein